MWERDDHNTLLLYEHVFYIPHVHIGHPQSSDVSILSAFATPSDVGFLAAALRSALNASIFALSSVSVCKSG